MKQLGNVYENSASAMAAILSLHFPTGSIVDLNCGLFTFYRNGNRERVVGVDIKKPCDVLADNKNLPFPDNAFDVAVVDPPYKRGDGKKYEARYGKAPKTETQVTWSYYAAIKEGVRVARGGMIVKVQDGTDGHRFHDRAGDVTRFMKAEYGIDLHDRCYNVRKSLPSTMAQGVPHFFQNGVSSWLIYKWRCKGPMKGVRF